MPYNPKWKILNNKINHSSDNIKSKNKIYLIELLILIILSLKYNNRNILFNQNIILLPIGSISKKFSILESKINIFKKIYYKLLNHSIRLKLMLISINIISPINALLLFWEKLLTLHLKSKEKYKSFFLNRLIKGLKLTLKILLSWLISNQQQSVLLLNLKR